MFNRHFTTISPKQYKPCDIARHKQIKHELSLAGFTVAPMCVNGKVAGKVITTALERRSW